MGTSTRPPSTEWGAGSRLRGQLFQRQDLVPQQPLCFLDASLEIAHRRHLAQVDADRHQRLRDFGRETRHRSEEHTSELQSQSNLVCRLLLEKKKKATGHVVA